jgi:hypothetical protein
MWPALRGASWYAGTGLLRGRGTRGAMLLSIAAAAALVWVAVALRQTSAAESSAGGPTAEAFDLATWDVAAMGVGVATVQTMLVAARIAAERVRESKIFRSLGLRAGALVAARVLELWALCLVGGVAGVVIASVFMTMGAGWRGTFHDAVMTTGAALLVPLAAVVPVSLWTWWRLSQTKRVL